MKEPIVFFGVQAVIAFEWFVAGVEKASGTGFRDGLAKTLSVFAANNPHSWYKTLLTDAIIPSAAGYAQAVIISEIGIGLGLFCALATSLTHRIPRITVASVGIASLAVALFLNANFYFAAGWTSSSTAGLNSLMFWIEAICLTAWVLWARERSLRH